MKLVPCIFAVAAVSLLGGASASADHRIWSAVLIASNSDKPTEAPPQLRDVGDRIKRVFGYNQFAILGSTTTELDDRVERWLVPSPHFWVNVKARRANSKEARGGYLLNLQLFHDRRPLVETEAKLAPDSPLFIRGPLHARGQLLIVLQVQP